MTAGCRASPGGRKSKPSSMIAGCPAPLLSSDGKRTWVDAALASPHSPKRSTTESRHPRLMRNIMSMQPFPLRPSPDDAGRREIARNSAVLFSQQRVISVEIAEPSDGAHPTRCCADRRARTGCRCSAERSASLPGLRRPGFHPVKPFAARRDHRPSSTLSQRLKPTLSGRSTTRLTVSGANALLLACERASQ